jgi:ribonuclease D
MEYAALDVVLLPAIWHDLSARLEGLGRTAWLEEDVGAMLESAARAVEPESAWQRVRGAGRLGDEALLLLRDLAAWREKTARDRDLPRGFVVRDPALLAIANTRPGGIDALRSMDVLHPSSVRKFGTAIVDICSAERSPDGVASMAAEVAKVDGRILDAMRAACALTAEELGVTPALLASRKELENLIRRLAAGDEPPARFSGWRRSVIADTLLAIYRERTT